MFLVLKVYFNNLLGTTPSRSSVFVTYIREQTKLNRCGILDKKNVSRDKKEKRLSDSLRTKLDLVITFARFHYGEAGQL